MYNGEEGEVCVELGYVGKKLSGAKANQPCKSKAGGVPVWLGEAPTRLEDLVCPICSQKLFLVVQVYAPTQVPRALCIFGCNRASCSVQPQAWRVIRTQGRGVPVEPEPDETKTIAPPTPPEPVPPAADAWGAANQSWDTPGGGEAWGADSSAWDIAAESQGLGDRATAAIDALLQEQEKRSTAKSTGHAAQATAASPGAGREGQRATTLSGIEPNTPPKNKARVNDCFPAKVLSFLPEPWGFESSSADDDAMNNRLLRYREQEEDRGLVAAIDGALGLRASETSNGQDVHGRGGGAAKIDEKYERTPARAKAVLRFADRVRRSPRQVVRYAYGGQPLWSASDPPKDDIPPCACGAARVFEMQLMPALISDLKMSDFADREADQQSDTSGATHVERGHGASPNTSSSLNAEAPQSSVQQCNTQASNNTDPRRGVSECPRGTMTATQSKDEEGSDDGRADVETSTPTAEDRERLRTWGMDWGVVAVWSCPASCETGFEEFVRIQLPV